MTLRLVTEHGLATSMQLVGQQQLNPAKGDHSLIASMFERLPKEAGFAEGLTRFVGYESCAAGANRLRFFGIEVDSLDAIPQGLIAWDLDDASWTVWQERDGRNTIVWREEIDWKWRAVSSFGFGNTLGEFAARGPAEWWSNGGREPQVFSLFALAPFDCRLTGFRDDVVLVDYDPTWPEQYERMTDWLRDRLGPDVALRIEHYGSTAIPGMPAKPVIDILVEIPSFDEGRRRALSVLNDPTWEYWSYSGHIVFFKRKELMGERTHHIHLAPRGHEIWEGLAFRDYLRSHSEDASQYAALKHELAAIHRTDRERYTVMKTSFVEGILHTTMKTVR